MFKNSGPHEETFNEDTTLLVYASTMNLIFGFIAGAVLALVACWFL